MDPSNVAAKVNKAIVYADREEWPAAVEAYRLALRDAPKRADLQVSLGDALAKQGQDDAAKHAYDQALKLDDKNVDAWRSRAELQRRANRLRDSIADYGHAVALDPEDADLLVARSRCWPSTTNTTRAWPISTRR